MLRDVRHLMVTIMSSSHSHWGRIRSPHFIFGMSMSTISSMLESFSWKDASANEIADLLKNVDENLLPARQKLIVHAAYLLAVMRSKELSLLPSIDDLIYELRKLGVIMNEWKVKDLWKRLYIWQKLKYIHEFFEVFMLASEWKAEQLMTVLGLINRPSGFIYELVRILGEKGFHPALRFARDVEKLNALLKTIMNSDKDREPESLLARRINTRMTRLHQILRDSPRWNEPHRPVIAKLFDTAHVERVLGLSARDIYRPLMASDTIIRMARDYLQRVDGSFRLWEYLSWWSCFLSVKRGVRCGVHSFIQYFLEEYLYQNPVVQDRSRQIVLDKRGLVQARKYFQFPQLKTMGEVMAFLVELCYMPILVRANHLRVQENKVTLLPRHLFLAIYEVYPQAKIDEIFNVSVTPLIKLERHYIRSLLTPKPPIIKREFRIFNDQLLSQILLKILHVLVELGAPPADVRHVTVTATMWSAMLDLVLRDCFKLPVNNRRDEEDAGRSEDCTRLSIFIPLLKKENFISKNMASKLIPKVAFSKLGGLVRKDSNLSEILNLTALAFFDFSEMARGFARCYPETVTITPSYLVWNDFLEASWSDLENLLSRKSILEVQEALDQLEVPFEVLCSIVAKNPAMIIDSNFRSHHGDALLDASIITQVDSSERLWLVTKRELERFSSRIGEFLGETIVFTEEDLVQRLEGTSVSLKIFLGILSHPSFPLPSPLIVSCAPKVYLRRDWRQRLLEVLMDEIEVEIEIDLEQWLARHDIPRCEFASFIEWIKNEVRKDIIGVSGTIVSLQGRQSLRQRLESFLSSMMAKYPRVRLTGVARILSVDETRLERFMARSFVTTSFLIRMERISDKVWLHFYRDVDEFLASLEQPQLLRIVPLSTDLGVSVQYVQAFLNQDPVRFVRVPQSDLHLLTEALAASSMGSIVENVLGGDAISRERLTDVFGYLLDGLRVLKWKADEQGRVLVRFRGRYAIEEFVVNCVSCARRLDINSSFFQCTSCYVFRCLNCHQDQRMVGFNPCLNCGHAELVELPLTCPICLTSIISIEGLVNVPASCMDCGSRLVSPQELALELDLMEYHQLRVALATTSKLLQGDAILESDLFSLVPSEQYRSLKMRVRKFLIQKGCFFMNEGGTSLRATSLDIYCQICKKSLPRQRSAFSCRECYRYVCQSCHDEAFENSAGGVPCPFCQNPLIKVPLHCKNCISDFVSLRVLENENECPNCGFLLESLETVLD